MSHPETVAVPVAPEPEFQVLAATGRRHAAVPALDFDVHVTEPGGRHVHAIALSAQIMIEPARRSYDPETREKLVELFGPPERWATTTRSLVWHQADVLVPAFVGSTTFRVAVPASFDMEVASSKYLYGLPDGELPLAFNFNGTVHYRGDDGRLQMSLVPWSCSAEFRMPVSIWRDLIEHYYPRSGWIPLHERTLQALQREKARRGLPTLDACVAELLDPVNELVESLLYEGYALYPYTPGATKNATPTPFGIVYPPAYARQLDSTFDHLELQCMVEGEDPHVTAELHFLLPSGERHVAEAQRIEGEGDFEIGGISIRTRLKGSDPLSRGGLDLRRVSFRVENRTEVSNDLTRGEALRHSLISTHPVLRVDGGRFISQLDAPCESVNTWPVLASADDDVMLGAAIILPDHPQIAPESRGNLFDNTEIEEALVLHVQVLSDEERAEIERSDPAVREMIERASAVTSEELLKLHGRVEVRDPVTREPPKPSADVRDPTRGLPEVEVDGVTFRRGGHVVVRPGLDADLQARMLEGRTVTVERIYRDYDGRVHLGVSVNQPGQEIMRDTGRFFWFFPPEVEVLQ